MGYLSLPVMIFLSLELSLFKYVKGYCREGRQASVQLVKILANNLTNQFICLEGHLYLVLSIFRLRERTRTPFTSIPVLLFNFVIKRRLLRRAPIEVVKERGRTGRTGRTLTGIQFARSSCRDRYAGGSSYLKLEDKSLQQIRLSRNFLVKENILLFSAM